MISTQMSLRKTSRFIKEEFDKKNLNDNVHYYFIMQKPLIYNEYVKENMFFKLRTKDKNTYTN